MDTNVSPATIRPFTYKASQAQLDELRRRILASRLPERETVDDTSQGVRLATMQQLADYWATKYDWRPIEAKMNSYPNFITEVDGLDIHFIHVRSRHQDALPILITHGWPGSVTHLLKVIDPLVDPTAHGGRASDAFHVVIPSMPGYGFSGKPTAPGWDPARIARAWAVLMERLKYDRYVAQGGDWGAIVTDLLGAQGPRGLVGIHSNMPGVVPPEIDKVLWAGGPVPAGLSREEATACEQLIRTYKNVQYAFFMASRPQTIAALTDSPVGLATFLIDFDPHYLAPLTASAFEGKVEPLSRDDILDNITLYWLTGTAVSAARLYWENKFNYFAPKGVTTLPVAVSVFPEELFQAPRTWTRNAYPKLVYYNRLAMGGHFPAWECPVFFVQELRAGFEALR